MKTKSFLMIFCLFAGAVLMSLSAQSIEKSYPGWSNSLFYTEVYCEGEQVDYVEGVLKVHFVRHYAGGSWWKWEIYQAKGEGQSLWTGEVFKYKEVDKVDWGEGIYSWTYHLKGNRGSKYMGHVTWDMNTGEIKVGPTSCK